MTRFMEHSYKRLPNLRIKGIFNGDLPQRMRGQPSFRNPGYKGVGKDYLKKERKESKG